jgi:cytochrome c oxidase subunit 3/cytochrome o ubiquinol oxidase subunit 3
MAARPDLQPTSALHGGGSAAASAGSVEGHGAGRGRVGMACMILTESALFSIFVVAYLFYVGKSLTGPYPKDVLDLPIFASVALLSSSITITLAVRALRRGAQGGFALWWGLTIALGLFFLGATAIEWKGLIYDHNLTIWTNLFGTTYYTLVGFHAGHVTVGLLLLGLTLFFGLRGALHAAHVERVEVLSWYWHFVDAVWVVVFTVVYVVGR